MNHRKYLYSGKLTFSKLNDFTEAKEKKTLNFLLLDGSNTK